VRRLERRAPAHASPGTDTGRLVLLAGLCMVVGQLVFRAWALYPSFFYLDDYSLLLEAQDRSLDGDYLLTPWNGHLMPGGRLVAWVVSQAGTLNWGLTATLTLALQAVTSLAALWMLITLAGRRWGILGPLALYLFTALTVSALMWWTACLNQLAMQLGFFVAVGAWVRYLRGRRFGWALAAYAGVAVGLLFDVKALLIVPVLVFLAAGWFCSGSPLARVRTLARRYWLSGVVAVPALAAYLAYYTTHVTQPFERPGPELAGELADSMLGTAFLTAVVGGPWRWAPLAPPNAFADPPGWTVQLAWVVAALVVLYGFLRRERTMRAWALLAGYLVVLMALVLVSRAPVFGSLIGLEYRYLTDGACVLALCTALAFLPLEGAEQSSRPRAELLLTRAVPRWTAAGLVVAVSASGLVSSVRQVGYWHHDNPSESYMHTLARDLANHGSVELVDRPAPEAIYPALFAPDNTVRRLTALVSRHVSFPDSSSRLLAVADDGGLRRAAIQLGVTSEPGPVENCGWPVHQRGKSIPLEDAAFDFDWWLRIGYLASHDSPVVVTAGESVVETSVSKGLGSLFVHVSGAFDDVRIDGVEPGTTICVDVVEVGQAVPGTAAP
jgi:hypothetical protein